MSPPTTAPLAPPSELPASVIERSLKIGKGEWMVDAVLSLPKKKGRHPVVVIVPGSGPANADLDVGPNKLHRELAWALAERGVGALRYNKRTRQHAARFKALGRQATIPEEMIEDPASALRILRRTAGVDPKGVFVFGGSLGGHLAPLIVEQGGGAAGVIIAFSSIRKPFDMIEEQVRYTMTLKKDQAGVEDSQKMLALIAELKQLKPDDNRRLLGQSASYWRWFYSYDAAHKSREMAATGIPILVMRAERDYLTTEADWKGWQETFAGYDNVTFVSHPVDHLMHAGVGKMIPEDYDKKGTIYPDFINDMAQWVLRNWRSRK